MKFKAVKWIKFKKLKIKNQKEKKNKRAEIIINKIERKLTREERNKFFYGYNMINTFFVTLSVIYIR